MLVLLVEDDARLVRALVAGLEEERHTVEAIADGDAALVALQAAAYDVCILDLSLPKRDGLAVLAAARQAGVSTPILVLTATNPGNFLGFVAIFSGITDVIADEPSFSRGIHLVSGVTAGAFFWWAGFAALVWAFRKKMTDVLLVKINQIGRAHV